MKKAKLLLASLLSGAVLAAAQEARAEPNQQQDIPPEGFSGQARGTWGVQSTPFERFRDLTNDTKTSVATDIENREVNQVKSLKDLWLHPDIITNAPQGPDDVPRLRLSLRFNRLAFGAGVKYEDGAFRPAEATIGYVNRDDAGAGLTLKAGLLDNMHRTALSGFTVDSQPLNLMTDKPFNDWMTLEGYAGVSAVGKENFDSKGHFSFNYAASVTDKVVSTGLGDYSRTLPSATAHASLETHIGKWGASIGGSGARLSVPGGGAPRYDATATAMGSLGDINDASATAVGEMTRIFLPGETPRDHMVGGLLLAGKTGNMARLHLAGTYAVDKNNAAVDPVTTKTITGTFGLCVGPALGPTTLRVCGDLAGGKADSNSRAEDIKVFIAAQGGARLSW